MEFIFQWPLLHLFATMAGKDLWGVISLLVFFGIDCNCVSAYDINV